MSVRIVLPTMKLAVSRKFKSLTSWTGHVCAIFWAIFDESSESLKGFSRGKRRV